MTSRKYSTTEKRIWLKIIMFIFTVGIIGYTSLKIIYMPHLYHGQFLLEPSTYFPDLSHEVVWVEVGVKLAVKTGKSDSVAMIAKQSYEAGLNPEKMLRISRCESHFDHLAINKDSSSRGLFQIIKSTQKEVEAKTGRKYDVFDPVDNIEMAIWLYKKYGDRPWNASKGCWRKI